MARRSPGDDNGRRHRPRATSYDVARLAGVSQSAVSRAFRDGSISPDTRRKVERAASELGYVPSKIAQSLITRRSHMIGVVMTELSARNYPDLLLRLSQEIQAAGSRMLLFVVPGDGAADAVSDLLAYHVDGIVAGTTLPDTVLDACQARHVPVVLYNRTTRRDHASSVGCDNATAMQHLVAHLCHRDPGRIAFVAGPENAPVGQARLAGATAALAARGRAIDVIVHGDFSYASGRALAHDLLRTEAPQTILCANDAMALGVLDAVRHDHGLSVPGAVAVAGFDDLPQASWPSYDLTTLTQPIAAMTRLAVQLLSRHIELREDANAQHLLPATLQVRGSTRPTG